MYSVAYRRTDLGPTFRNLAVCIYISQAFTQFFTQFPQREIHLYIPVSIWTGVWQVNERCHIDWTCSSTICSGDKIFCYCWSKSEVSRLRQFFFRGVMRCITSRIRGVCWHCLLTVRTDDACEENFFCAEFIDGACARGEIALSLLLKL